MPYAEAESAAQGDVGPTKKAGELTKTAALLPFAEFFATLSLKFLSGKITRLSRTEKMARAEP